MNLYELFEEPAYRADMGSIYADLRALHPRAVIWYLGELKRRNYDLFYRLKRWAEQSGCLRLIEWR